LQELPLAGRLESCISHRFTTRQRLCREVPDLLMASSHPKRPRSSSCTEGSPARPKSRRLTHRQKTSHNW